MPKKNELRRKLLVTTSTLPRFPGDPEPRFVLDLARALAERFDITILAPGDPAAAAAEIMEGIRVRRYRYAPLRSLERLAYPGAMLPRLKTSPRYWPLAPLLLFGLRTAVRRLLVAERFDCVWAHWLVPQGFVQSTIGTGTDTPPFIVTCHGADVYGISGAVGRALQRRALTRASAVTVVSEHLREHLTKVHGPGMFDKRPPVVIPMGVDVELFNPEKKDTAWACRIDAAQPVILFVGRLAGKKGVAQLVQAMAEPPLRELTATLVIVGAGPLDQSLRKQARDLMISDRVRFLGAIDHSRLATIYASADIVCAPSVIEGNCDREGAPVVLNEAAASGKPLITTSVSAAGNIVVEGETGLIVEPGNPAALSAAIHRLAVDPSLRERMGSAALQRCRALSWQSIAGRYLQVIDDLLERNRE